jgi:hypothetical protein
MTELLGSTVGAQPEIVPPPVANRKTDGAVKPFTVMSNPEPREVEDLSCRRGRVLARWCGNGYGVLPRDPDRVPDAVVSRCQPGAVV